MAIRDRLRAVFGETSALRLPQRGYSIGKMGGQYHLNSQQVTYELARELYRNTSDKYKLGAWAAKPIVNTAAGFMGAPKFITKTQDDRIQQEMDDGLNEWDSRFLQINRNSCRDGDVYARIEMRQNRFDPNDVDFELRMIPPEWVEPITDPLTGELTEVVITWPAENKRREGRQVRKDGDFNIIEILTPTERTLEVDGNAPAEVRATIEARSSDEMEDNRWGFIPIVHFRNDPEDTHIYGMSDLEPVEPFMKAYHDVMLYMVQGAKTMARPKTKFKLADVDAFLKRNFSEQEIKDKKLKFADKEIFLMQDNDDIDFIVADTGLSGTTTLLEFFYYCIVDVSQTPEFAFGTAVASSKASVSEQMPVLARNIRRKRGEYLDPYQELGSMFLAMSAQVGMPKPETYKVDVEWEELTPRDDSEAATILESNINALVTGVDAGLVSLDAAIDFLQEFVPTLLPPSTEGNEADEKQRIATGKLFLDRLDAGEGPDNGPPGIREVITGGAAAGNG